MPFVVYIFTLSAFALGLAEFVPIGLTDVMAHSLNVDIEQAGSAVTTYALGATFAAPVLTALTAGWTRKCTMLMTVLVFTVGSLAAAVATNLSTLLIARFVAGMGHGLFLAVASSTAARLVGAKKASSAVAVVFGGFTIAMAIGVPVSTYLGGTISWRPVLGAIGAFGALGFLGLLLGMKEPPQTQGHEGSDSVGQALKAIVDPVLLFAALVTVLGYAGSFTAYTYIAPLLTKVTHVSSQTVGIFMLVYGVLAAIGNVIGGKLTDRLGVNRASVALIAGITTIALGMWALASSSPAMGILVALLGMFTFAAVPALQARLVGVAEQHAPHAHGVAAGLNIAGFNSGIALGSLVGGMTLGTLGVSYTGIAGAVISTLGLMVLLVQLARSGGVDYRAVAGTGH
ncbi:MULTISPECIES: MFS transporter [Cupriavidus]|uniref:MFS transporter n=1 Tax=Cupriavidus basilensis TaxID=68895 RepID=A0A643G0J8_9BURK|nr:MULTISPECIES: MFS transporter [Cupriavidus]KUE88134.1 MFS transporter [Cupriavidus necator]NOV23477.1 MFS transporter [Cupriavidus necator]QOT81563.1 MFS transporter [Cupriavidus basilensis]BDB30244.1 MFS transporter [Cupriavidus sp. P-10]